MANIKISNLASASAVTGDDLFVIVNDPSGVPSTQKINAQGVLKFITGSNFNTLTVNVLTASNLNVVNLFTASEMAVNNSLNVGNSVTASSFLILNNGNINGNLTVGGILTAQEYHTEVVSASIIYQSGSTKFGNDSGDTHQFTGSLLVSNGNVGIGTSSPTKKLHVVGSDALINTITVGLGNNNISSNTAVGFQSLAVVTIGTENTAVGYRSLEQNTSGDGNIGLGSIALVANKAGNNNVAVGPGTLFQNISGSENIAVGSFAGQQLIHPTDSNNNILIGTQAANNLITGSNNIFIGKTAGSGITSISDTFILKLGSNERMRIDSAGNVGIGTTSPVTTLDVNGSINILNSNNLTWGGVYSGGNPTIAGSSAGASSKISFYPRGNVSGEQVTITAAGNVGIGTTFPDFTLAVTGTLGVSGNTTISTISGTQAQFTGLTGTYTAPLGTVSLPSYTFVGDPNTGIYSPAADTLVFVEGGTEVIRISPDTSITASGPLTGSTALFTTITGSTVTGSTALFTRITGSTAYFIDNVGIGIASPATKLDVNGSIRVAGGSIYGQVAEITASVSTTYTLQSSDSGKFLTINNGSPVTLTVPSGLPTGFTVSVCQLGAGQITVSSSGVTINNRQSHTKAAGQHAVISIVGTAANTYVLVGDTTA